MTKPTGVGRGGWRPGAGRKPKPRLDPPDAPSTVRSLLPPGASGDLLSPALHRLVDDACADLGHRLRRIEETGADNRERLEALQETLERVLRHQTAIARTVGAIEPTALPRHTRRRPLGV